MKNSTASIASMDEYIAGFPEDIQKKLQEVRATIKTAAPDAKEIISYQVPTFFLFGNLVHFAATKNHISFFPTPSGVEAFIDELSQYSTSKGTIRFPLDNPLPLDLIRRITIFRVVENLKRAEEKNKKEKGK
jgi:uncharacterized protein YdhG (YjbR/CyaY superfamily)